MVNLNFSCGLRNVDIGNELIISRVIMYDENKQFKMDLLLSPGTR